MLKIKPLYLIAIVLITAFATWKLTLMSRYPSASITLLTVKRLDSSLTVANEMMRRSNTEMIFRFDENLKKPETVKKAKIWSPIMHAAIDNANRMCLQVETIKTALKKEAGLTTKAGEKRYHEDDIDAATRLLINQGQGQVLMDSLKRFSLSLINLVSEQSRRKLSQLPVAVLLQEQSKSYFKETPAIAAIAILTKFQNDVLQSGTIVADFCSNQISTYSDNFLDKFATLVSQNTTTLSAGETLEIAAGLGAFTTASKPSIIINGEPVALNENGVAVYKIKVGGNDGKIPVSFSFKDPNTGETRVINSTVSYTVTKQ